MAPDTAIVLLILVALLFGELAAEVWRAIQRWIEDDEDSERR